MSLEQKIDALNETMKKVIEIFEVYPNPIDEKIIDPKKVEASKAKDEAEADNPINETENVDADFKPKHTIDEVAEIARKAIQANKTENRQKVKDKLDELGIPKITATPDKHIDSLYEFLESLV